MKKLKAFTIIELVVAMLLTSIVVSIAYVCLDLLGSSYKQFSETQKQVDELVLLQKQLAKDFNSCNKAIFYREGLECTYDNEKIYYKIYDDEIIRKSYGREDRWSITLIAWEGAFCHVPLEVDYMPVDEIYFRASKDEREVACYTTKKYSAEELMDFEREHGI